MLAGLQVADEVTTTANDKDKELLESSEKQVLHSPTHTYLTFSHIHAHTLSHTYTHTLSLSLFFFSVMHTHTRTPQEVGWFAGGEGGVVDYDTGASRI